MVFIVGHSLMPLCHSNAFVLWSLWSNMASYRVCLSFKTRRCLLRSAWTYVESTQIPSCVYALRYGFCSFNVTTWCENWILWYRILKSIRCALIQRDSNFCSWTDHIVLFHLFLCIDMFIQKLHLFRFCPWFVPVFNSNCMWNYLLLHWMLAFLFILVISDKLLCFHWVWFYFS